MFARFFVFLNGEEQIMQPPGEALNQARARSIVKKTWKELMRNECEVGKQIFDFVLIKELSMSVLFMNSQIERQSILFMKMLDTVVGYLDDEDNLDARLSELGVIHNRRYGVKNQHFKHFRTAFMKAVRLYIPMNPDREAAWLWFWDRIIRTMSLPVQIHEPATRYILAIHESFDSVMESPKEFGDTLYKELLDEKCEFAIFFETIELKSESARLLSMVQHTLRSLDDQTAFENKIRIILFKYGEYNITIPQLQLFGDIFIKTLKAANENHWESVHDESWKWVWNITLNVVQTEFERNRPIFNN